jgi:4-carboxymuconolactone decarboxylase
MTAHGSARIPLITDRDQLPEDQRHHFDHIMETRGYVGGPFAPLLHSPELCGQVARLGTYVRYESGLPGAHRELAIITTGREFDCAYEWAAHEPIAREEGVSDATMEAVATRAPLDEFPDEARLIVTYARQLLRDHRIDDETFGAARDRYGLQGLADLTATIGFYSLIACTLNAFEVMPDADTPSLP